ncbi:MAG: 2-C-methyl-D-erythritol 4-phosphate cytidylyltransferase [Oscillospiraceae bacterium]|nr:2-C-methyl-D-erythritol 4-phosphate cytidylyltransferase [Oscillospiraceae bacterium]
MSFFDKLRSALDFADAQRMKNRPFCSVIVPAAGNSSRMNGQDKLFEDLCGMPVLARTLKAVNDCEYVDEIVIPTRPDCIGRIAAMMSAYALDKITRIIPGGESRTESVRIALSECSRDAGLIAIHDGARPLASTELIGHCIRSAMQTRACLAAVPVKDTIKVVSGDYVADTPARETMYAAQTPQVFDAALLKAAYEKALEEGKTYTDDASVVEAMGKHVFICTGSYRNIKITDPADLRIAALLLEEEDV